MGTLAAWSRQFAVGGGHWGHTGTISSTYSDFCLIFAAPERDSGITLMERAMNILDKIIAHKHLEVAQRKEQFPERILDQSVYFQRPAASLRERLLRAGESGIIAEFKRRSPSAGDIRGTASVETVTTGYAKAGASALSVLTDTEFFGGSNGDLSGARHENTCPILRKDFVIDEYQIVEARAIGADAVLLIAACLDPGQTRQLASFAQSLGMEVLLELHEPAELDHLNEYIDIAGINNRNLRDFSVSIATSLEMAGLLPKDLPKVSESGLNDPQAVVDLKYAGFNGFLIGEHFMRQADPGEACRAFIEKVNNLEDLLRGAIA